MNYSLTGSRGAFSVSGQSATLTVSQQTFASFFIAGQDASLEYARRFAAEAGSFALSGEAASVGRSLTAEAGAFSLSAFPAGLTPLLLGGGFQSLFADAGLAIGRRLAFAAGSYSLSAFAASFGKGKALAAEPGSFLLSAPGAWFIPSQFSGQPGGFLLAGADAALNYAQSTRIYRNQTTIEWPEDVLGCPLRAGYTGTILPMFERTTISEAPPSFFRYKADERRMYRVEFIWTLSQLSAFETFFNDTLNKGIRWFMMRHTTDGQPRSIYCHIAEAYTITPQPDRLDLYRVAFTVMSFWRVAKSPDWS